MRSTITIAVLAAVPVAYASFSNTYTLMAWSDSATSNLESFRPFASKGSQDYQISLAAAAGEECIPTLVVSAPGFSHDDLGLLSPSSSLRTSWTSAQAQMHIPYLGKPSAGNLRTLVDRRIGSCETDSTVFRQLKPLARGSSADAKARWMRNLDGLVERSLDKLSHNYIVILSSVPDLGKHYRQKRQISDEEWEQIEQESTPDDGTSSTSDLGVDVPVPAASSIVDGLTRPVSVFEQAGKNGTVDPALGLLYHYSFTSPALIFAALIMLLCFIPIVLLSINAIASIGTLKGLENGKMIGGQLGESKKDQ